MLMPIKGLLRLADDGVACCGSVRGSWTRCIASLIIKLRSNLTLQNGSFREILSSKRFFFGTRISIINSAVVVPGALGSVL